MISRDGGENIKPRQKRFNVEQEERDYKRPDLLARSKQ